MQLIYEGKDITKDIDIRTADLTDCSGGKFDSIILEINNPTNDWSRWKPQKSHELELRKDGFSSGKMFIAIVKQQDGLIILKAIPIKKESKEKRTKSWENVTFLELLNEFAGKHGLSLKTYGIQNYLYNRVNQVDETDFAFLNKRCMIEGYILKVSNNQLVIFDEKSMESQNGITLAASDIVGNFKYDNKDTYGAVRIVYGNIDNTFKSPSGTGEALLIANLEVNSIGEAQRFAKNILRNSNKYEHMIAFDTKLNTNIAAGSSLSLSGLGLSDGKYYIYQIIDKMVNDKTTFFLRQIPSW
ncbi:phage late control D family protein [Cellulosilyticum sp. I15G10I2]|uniref:phage late control D family protein n=1 Tax=Cellulosilyticum sp. I15G10I2 TaxID=1892843 RepID=UPI00085C6673|nr:phage late control D family protein [Cellulosilyticum sp. I15G10I2]